MNQKLTHLILGLLTLVATAQGEARVNQCQVLFTPSTYQLATMGARYKGEEKATLEGRLKAHYLNVRSVKKYAAEIRDGGLFAFGRSLTAGREKLRFIYVLSPEGTLYLGPFADGPRSFYHSTFLRGKPVAAAGEMEIVNGHVYLNLGSGHYTPNPKHLEQVAEWFVQRGFPLSKLHTSESASSFAMAKPFLGKQIELFARELALDSESGREAARKVWGQHPEWIEEIVLAHSLPGRRNMVLNLARLSPPAATGATQSRALAALLRELTFEVNRDAEFQLLFARAPIEVRAETLKNLLFDLGQTSEAMIDEVTRDFLQKTAPARAREDFQTTFQLALAEASADTGPGGMMASLLFVSHRAIEVRNSEMVELLRSGWPAYASGMRELRVRRNVLSFMNQMAKEVVEFFE